MLKTDGDTSAIPVVTLVTSRERSAFAEIIATLYAEYSTDADSGLHRNANELSRRGIMNVQLTNDEVQTFRQMLHDYLPGLKFEVARTDAKEMLHALVKRQTLCERLIEQLGTQ
jgi:aspartate aminotransferase-like enzyme